MTQVCIDSLYRVGFLFIGTHLVGRAIVQVVIGWKRVTVVLSGLWSAIQTGLQVLCASFTDDIPTEKAVCGSINNGQNVDFVFFCLTKVYNSSNSATFGLWGIGAGGNLASYT